ncbi:MAG: hypothetical protein ACTHK8_08390 [Ginsengibacter sp.]
MKRMILFMIMLAFSYRLPAQTFDEWFHQKKTQIKYLLQQIAANEVYIGYLQKGYKIAESGLHTINDIKHGDFNLHNDFFNSLKNVNAKVKGMAEVAGIIALQVQIVKQARSAVQRINASDQFTATEVSYLQNVFNQLLDECTKDINALIDIVTPGNLTMTDDERMKRIDGIYTDMQDKASFSKSFNYQAAMLAVQRRQEAVDVGVSKKLNGVD